MKFQNETAVETLLATSRSCPASQPIMFVAAMLYQGKYRVESTRLRGWDYRSRGWYFVTICSAHRKCIFGTVEGAQVCLSRVGVIADAELKAMPSHYKNVELVEHIVMPNHIHAIVLLDGEHMFSPRAKMSLEPALATFSPPKSGSLSAIIRSYKAGVTQRARAGRPAEEVWQAGSYDHILRGEKVIAAVREYIRNNPENWGEDRDNPEYDSRFLQTMEEKFGARIIASRS